MRNDGRRRTDDNHLLLLHPFLGWQEKANEEPPIWPSQSDLTQDCDVTRQRIGQVINGARERWAKSEPLAGLRGTIAEVLRARGGVMVHHELIAYVLAARGVLAEEPQRSQLASAAVRAAVEAEHISEAPRFDEFRSGKKIFVALDSELRPAYPFRSPTAPSIRGSRPPG